eukprot:225120-Pleurochrysis_carterae.AAC.1
MLEAVTYTTDEAKTRVLRLTVDKVGPVCQQFWAKAHSVSQCTSNRLISDAKAGRLEADNMWNDAGDHGDLDVNADDAPASIAMEETIEWWVMWLELEDQMPNEPVI